MTNAIPKEQQTPYQRWEMASFGETRPSHIQDAAPASAATMAEFAAVREEARTVGYAEGLEQGRIDGLAAGRLQAKQEVVHLQQMAQSFGTEVAQANEVIAQDLLELSLDLTRAMLKTALNVRRELVLPIVGEAIRYLPSLQQPALLFLHAEDAKLVREHMADELATAGWRIAEDPHMERGGCRIETGSNQIDASLPTRWQRITTALGKESDWIGE